MILSSKEKATLKSKAVNVKTTVKIGNNGITDAVIASIEEALNAWTQRGWQFDTIQFVVREASKRPSMAFVLFVREVEKE